MPEGGERRCRRRGRWWRANSPRDAPGRSGSRQDRRGSGRCAPSRARHGRPGGGRQRLSAAVRDVRPRRAAGPRATRAAPARRGAPSSRGARDPRGPLAAQGDRRVPARGGSFGTHDRDPRRARRTAAARRQALSRRDRRRGGIPGLLARAAQGGGATGPPDRPARRSARLHPFRPQARDRRALRRDARRNALCALSARQGRVADARQGAAREGPRRRGRAVLHERVRAISRLTRGIAHAGDVLPGNRPRQPPTPFQ